MAIFTYDTFLSVSPTFFSPTPKARANLLRDSEDQFRKSDESAYSIDSVIPSQLSLSSSKRHSLASSAHASIEYQPFSFDKKLFLSRVYTRNAKNIMIKKIFKSRIQAGGKTKETLMPNWEAIRSDLEADSLLPSSHEASSADNESLRPSSYHENIEHRFQNKDPRSMTIHGDSAVFLRACEQGDSVQVKRLLVGGFNVHLRFTGAMYFGYTAIHVAALHGYVNVVEILLDHSADVNDEDARRKRRPLHFAAGGRKLPMVRFLIRRGARVDAEAHDAIQPIHEASWSGSVDIIDALIEGGAPVNCTDRFGYQPLHWAVFTPSQPNVIRYLSQMNADIDVEISSGLRAVHLACKTDPKNLSTLLALGAKTDFDDGTEPALIAAVEAQRKEAVEILLKHGVDPNQEATDGSTALHKLATLHSRNLGESSNDRETRRLLLDKGANLYVKDSSGNQVIHYLASQNLTSTESFVAAKELAELLLERGADGDATDRHGYGALYLAIICGNSLLSTLLFTRGARILKRTGLLRMEVGVDTTINSQVPKHVVYSWQYNLDHSGWMKRATDLDFVVSKSDAGYIIASQMKQKLVNLEHYLESTFE